MQMKRATVIAATLGMVLFLGGAVLAEGLAGNSNVPWHAFASGGAEMTSDRFTMISTAGQELVGGTSSEGYQLGAGFWTVMDAEHIIFLPLALRNH